jgi:hypothetical protein
MIPLLGEQTVNGLAAFVHGPIEVAPLAFHADVGRVHAPAAPEGALAAVEGVFESGAVFQDPTVKVMWTYFHLLNSEASPMTNHHDHGKRQNSAPGWRWLFVKVAVAGAVLGIGAEDRGRTTSP